MAEDILNDAIKGDDISMNEFPTGFPNQIIGLSQEGSAVSMRAVEFISTMGCLDRNQVYGTNENNRYVQIAHVTDITEEGISNNFILLVCGGNNYTESASLMIVSITIHRGSVHTNKNLLMRGIIVGYVFENNQLDLWIRSDSYNHPVNVIVINSSSNFSLLHNMVQSELPEGFVEI